LNYGSDNESENLKSVMKYILHIESLKVWGTSISKTSQQTFFNNDLRNISEFDSLSTLYIGGCALQDIPDGKSIILFFYLSFSLRYLHAIM
jgi:hypothetical protein